MASKAYRLNIAYASTTQDTLVISNTPNNPVRVYFNPNYDTSATWNAQNNSDTAIFEISWELVSFFEIIVNGFDNSNDQSLNGNNIGKTYNLAVTLNESVDNNYYNQSNYIDYLDNHLSSGQPAYMYVLDQWNPYIIGFIEIGLAGGGGAGGGTNELLLSLNNPYNGINANPNYNKEYDRLYPYDSLNDPSREGNGEGNGYTKADGTSYDSLLRAHKYLVSEGQKIYLDKSNISTNLVNGDTIKLQMCNDLYFGSGVQTIKHIIYDPGMTDWQSFTLEKEIDGIQLKDYKYLRILITDNTGNNIKYRTHVGAQQVPLPQNLYSASHIYLEYVESNNHWFDSGMISNHFGGMMNVMMPPMGQSFDNLVKEYFDESKSFDKIKFAEIQVQQNGSDKWISGYSKLIYDAQGNNTTNGTVKALFWSDEGMGSYNIQNKIQNEAPSPSTEGLNDKENLSKIRIIYDIRLQGDTNSYYVATEGLDLHDLGNPPSKNIIRFAAIEGGGNIYPLIRPANKNIIELKFEAKLLESTAINTNGYKIYKRTKNTIAWSELTISSITVEGDNDAATVDVMMYKSFLIKIDIGAANSLGANEEIALSIEKDKFNARKLTDTDNDVLYYTPPIKNISIVKQIVNLLVIQDNTSPVIDLKGLGNIIYKYRGQGYTDQKGQEWDATDTFDNGENNTSLNATSDFDVIGFNANTPGNYVITYTADDGSNSGFVTAIATLQRTIIVADFPEVVLLQEGNELKVLKGDTTAFYGNDYKNDTSFFRAKSLGGNLTSTISTNVATAAGDNGNELNINTVGSYVYVHKALDGKSTPNESAEVRRTIIVKDSVISGQIELNNTTPAENGAIVKATTNIHTPDINVNADKYNLSYQWEKSSDNTNWSEISEQTDQVNDIKLGLFQKGYLRIKAKGMFDNVEQNNIPSASVLISKSANVSLNKMKYSATASSYFTSNNIPATGNNSLDNMAYNLNGLHVVLGKLQGELTISDKAKNILSSLGEDAVKIEDSQPAGYKHAVPTDVIGFDRIEGNNVVNDKIFVNSSGFDSIDTTSLDAQVSMFTKKDDIVKLEMNKGTLASAPIITFTDVSVDDNANTAKKYKISNDNTTAVKLFDVTTEYNAAISNGANFSSSNLLSKDVILNDTVLDEGKIIAISENTNTSNVSKFTIVELSSININGTTTVTDAPTPASSGDPYIFPYEGPSFKIPGGKAIYRLFQNDKENVYVNALVDIGDQTHMKHIYNYIRDKVDPNCQPITDGYFYKAFYINIGGNKIKIDMNKFGTFELENNDNFKFLGFTDKLVESGVFAKEPIREYKWSICHNKNYYNLKIDIYSNPQIYNGISLSCTEEIMKNSQGLLIKPYFTKLMRLPRLNIDKYAKINKNLKSKKKTIMKSIKFVEKGEKWVKQPFN
jgi:hypothetical protein